MEMILNPGRKQAKLDLAFGTAVFIGAALWAHAVASHAGQRQTFPPRAEVATSIAEQGNDAVRQIRKEARRSARLVQPTPLADLASVAIEVAVATK